MSKRKASTAKRSAWDWCSKYIRMKYADHAGFVKCVTCGAMRHWKEMDAGHFISKSRGSAIYFEEENIHPQCAGCNRFHEGAKHMYTLFMIDTYGREKVEELEALARTVKSYRLADYEELEAYFRGKAKEMMTEVA